MSGKEIDECYHFALESCSASITLKVKTLKPYFEIRNVTKTVFAVPLIVHIKLFMFFLLPNTAISSKIGARIKSEVV